MAAQVPDEVSRRRLHALQALLTEQQIAFNASLTGRVLPVLFEKKGRHGAQAIGLSGLITPSLEEMSHVAAEMQRQGFADGRPIPLLIGGATTSRAHTAIKIAPHYGGPVIYVPDASRAVGVVTSLLSEGQRDGYAAEVAADYDKIRAQHAGKKGVTLVKLEAARANAFQWNGDPAYTPVKPAQLLFQPWRTQCQHTSHGHGCQHDDAAQQHDLLAPGPEIVRPAHDHGPADHIGQHDDSSAPD